MDEHEKIINSYISANLNIAIDDFKISGKGFKVKSGSGRVLSNEQGSFSLEIYTQDYSGTFGLRLKPGEILREEEYCKIEAISQRGLKVSIPRVSYPNTEQSIPGFAKLTFFPHEVLFRSSFPLDSTKSLINGVITPLSHLPSNDDYKITNDNPVFGYKYADRWFNMETNEVHFGLMKDDSGICHLAVWTEKETGSPLEDVADAFLQALSFRYGKKVEWLAYTKEANGLKETKLKKYKVESRSFYPPLPLDSDKLRPEVEKAEIDLLRKATALFFNKDQRSILSSLAMSWDSTANYFSNQSLIVSISVERLVSKMIELYPPEDLKQEEEKFAAYKQRIVGVISNDQNLKSEKFIDRIVKGIDSFSFLNTQEKLNRIKSSSLKMEVTDDEINAWKKMRHPLAHGKSDYNYEDEDELQERMDFLACAANILNKLILALLKYEGPFRDYSTRGWPLKQFVESKDVS
jgi:hypothetical protein